MARNEDEDVFAFEAFMGLRNTVGAESFEPSDLAAALNVDITDALRIRRRKGYSPAIVSGSYHSLWSNNVVALVVSAGALLEILPDHSTRVIRDDLVSAQRMYYTSIADRVFYSNGVDAGVVQAGASRSWGLAVPALQPTVALIGGGLPAGRYQYTLTYQRADGQESGALRAVVIDVPANAGLSFTDIPVSSDPTVTAKRLYLSAPNGDLLFAMMTLPNAATTATYEVPRAGTLPLQTQFLAPPPPGVHLGTFAGRVLLARGERLYQSEPFAPELFDLRKALPFESPVTLVAPLEDGVYLGTETNIFWLPGREPGKWELLNRATYGAIPGTLAYGSAEDVVEGGQGPAAFMATKQGLCVGLPGGNFRNLTNERFNYPVKEEGAGLVRDNGGSVQYLATLRGTSRAGNTAF